MNVAIEVQSLSKSYLGTVVLDAVDALVQSGTLTVISGPSGSGKTTLLNLVSGLDNPDDGRVCVGGTDVTELSLRERGRYRAENGHVFQRSGLLGGLTVQENIEVGHTLTGSTIDRVWVRHLVERLNIDGLLNTHASRISGGQAQRVALIRALAHRPAHLFADEPTASLDTASTHAIHTLLRQVAENEGTTVLMVSHDEISGTYAHDAIRLLDGRTSIGDGETT